MLKIGISVVNYGILPDVEFLKDVAIKSEQYALDSLWVSEHIIVPKDDKPWTRVFEGISLLSLFAGLTEKILLGTSVLVLPLRNPIIVGKQLASLDVLSNGRLLLGLGLGWNKSEFEILKKDFLNRSDTMKDSVKLLRQLWSGDFEKSGFVSEPLPIQKNGPPILFGGQSVPALQRVASIGDGWHPVGISSTEYEEKMKMIKQINDRKYLWTLRLGFCANKSISPNYIGTDGSPRLRLVGSSDQIISEIEKYRKIGLEHIALDIRVVTKVEYLEQVKIISQIKSVF